MFPSSPHNYEGYDRNIKIDVTLTILTILFLIFMFNYREIKMYIMNLIIKFMLRDEYIEEIYMDKWLIITKKSNNQSIIVPYNSDLIFEEKIITIDNRELKIRRGFDIDSLNINYQSDKTTQVEEIDNIDFIE